MPVDCDDRSGEVDARAINQPTRSCGIAHPTGRGHSLSVLPFVPYTAVGHSDRSHRIMLEPCTSHKTCQPKANQRHDKDQRSHTKAHVATPAEKRFGLIVTASLVMLGHLQDRQHQLSPGSGVPQCNCDDATQPGAGYAIKIAEARSPAAVVSS